MAKKAEPQDVITLIVPTGGVVDRERPADARGKQHKWGSETVKKFFGLAHDVPKKTVEEGLIRVMGQVETILKSVAASPTNDFVLEGMEVGVAISGEGSVGIVTVGAEASLSLQFRKVPPQTE